MTRQLGRMDMALYEKVIDEVSTYSEPVRSKEIELFHFGESLLHPRIDDMVGYASARSLNVTLSVNAPLLTPNMAERVLARNPFRLIVSLDGHDQETYAAVRGAAADHAAAVRNVRNLISLVRQTRPATRICLRLIHLNANASSADRFKREWEAEGITVDVRPFFPWTEKEMADLGHVTKYPPFMPCPFPWQYLVVQWDGTVVPCCRDYNGANAVGNVRESSLKEIWNGSSLAAIREQHRTGRYGANRLCSGCMDIYYTDGAQTAGRTARVDTIPALWAAATEEHAQRPLLVSAQDAGMFTYGDAREVVARVASALWTHGARKGDRVCVCSPLHTEAVLLFWACAIAGVVFVPLDSQLPPDVLAGIIARAQPRVVFCDRVSARKLPGVSPDDIVVFDDEEPATDGPELFTAWIDAGGEQPTDADVQPSDAAAVLFTSGTTGQAKGVVLSHGALTRSGRLISDTYQWRTSDVLLSLGDLHAMSGLRNPCIAALHAGCSFVVAPVASRSNALLVAECVKAHRVTILGSVPAVIRQFNDVSARVEDGSLSSLRQVLSTGSALSPDVAAKFERNFHIPVLNYYGMTETTGICIGVPPGMAGPCAGTIGVPLCRDIRIESEDGVPVAPGRIGELLVSADTFMTGYYAEPEATNSVLKDGWYRTGDMVRRDDSGYITLVGRKGDAIKDTRGEWVHPIEVEVALERHGLVHSAGVCRYADPDGQEQLAAFVVPSGQVADRESFVFELRRHLLAEVGSHKTPARFHIVAELPTGTNGKLLRRELRRLLHETA
jgi:radical SAM protein with 4Fe4S-binding SPASM domain